MLALLGWFFTRARGSTRTTATLAYPVLLVDTDKIAEVCLDAEELVLRPENQDYTIEQHFFIVDATGARYRIEHYRLAEKKPSTLSRIADASVYSVKRFRVAFDLRADGVLSREQVMAQLRDRAWALPAGADTAALGTLFVAYRVDRYKEYGNARDRMPE